MLRFLIDENVRREVDEFLKSCGHDTARPPRGTPDDGVAMIAKRASQILLTHDLGFSNIFRFPPQEYAGIVVIRILPPSVSLLSHALTGLLRALPEAEFPGKLIILEPNGFRIYKETE